MEKLLTIMQKNKQWKGICRSKIILILKTFCAKALLKTL